MQNFKEIVCKQYTMGQTLCLPQDQKSGKCFQKLSIESEIFDEFRLKVRLWKPTNYPNGLFRAYFSHFVFLYLDLIYLVLYILKYLVLVYICFFLCKYLFDMLLPSRNIAVRQRIWYLFAFIIYDVINTVRWVIDLVQHDANFNFNFVSFTFPSNENK